ITLWLMYLGPYTLSYPLFPTLALIKGSSLLKRCGIVLSWLMHFLNNNFIFVYHKSLVINYAYVFHNYNVTNYTGIFLSVFMIFSNFTSGKVHLLQFFHRNGMKVKIFKVRVNCFECTLIMLTET
ncbi:hypothetical protein L9F63_001127, partial [Diploptera punctata]